MAYLTVNGALVESGVITLPRSGVWHAELNLAAGLLAQSSAALVLGNALELYGTVRLGGEHADTTSALVVGGAGGFRDDVTPQHFRKAPMRIPLERALSDVGEELSPSSTESVLTAELEHWVTLKEPAQRVVAELARTADVNWRVLPDGRTWLGEETWPTVSVGYEVAHAWPSKGRVQFVLDAPLLLPGYTFQGRKVGSVTYVIRADALLCDVWFEP